MPRNLSLELARGVASVIVFCGHLLFSQTRLEVSSDQSLLKIFQFGGTAVTFFFSLSGYVLFLSWESRKLSRSSWIKLRLIRLLPLYFATWLLPLIFFTLITGNFPADPKSLTASALGLQSLYRDWYLSDPNPPLWSISVEIIFAFFLPSLANFLKEKRVAFILFMFLLFLFPILRLNLIPFLIYLPYCMLGMLIGVESQQNRISGRQIRKVTLILLTIIIVYSDLGLSDSSIVSNIWIISFDFTVLLFLSNSSLGKFRTAANFIGSRSYALYVCHWPILVLLNYSVFRDQAEPNPFSYLFLTIGIVLSVTEFLYRMIDNPVIKILQRKKSG